MKNRITSLFISVILFCTCIPVCAGSETAASLQEIATLIEEHTARLESSFSILCKRDLITELKKDSPVGKETTLLSEIMMRAGCGPYSVTWYDDHILLSDISYYTGWQILHRYTSGTTARLSSREQKTLEKAHSLVSGASGSDLEKERYIYDALCRQITYEAADDGTGEKDCAVGALLNGMADCDGYSDAMVLCCGLAGIPCRYIHGECAIPEKKGAGDTSHMWNLVFIGSSWLMCDVTWGDQNRAEPSYLYFNIGWQDASKSYSWNSETQFPNIAPVADFSVQLMPDMQPAVVHSLEEVYLAARTAVSCGKHHLTLYSPDEILWQTDAAAFHQMLSHGAINQYSYCDSGRLFELSDILLPDTAFCFCDSKTDILSAIQGYADAGVHSFTLYLNPPLAEQLLSKDHYELQQVFSVSCLASFGSYQYSTESGSIVLLDASFIDPLPSCESVEDILSMIRRKLPAKPSSLTFLLTEALDFDSVSESVATAVYSLGVSSFSYSWSGSRITLNLTYFDNYCIAESKADVLSYMILCKEGRKNDLRVYCSGKLYSSLIHDNASEFFSLLTQAGFSEYSVYSSDEYKLITAEVLR